MRNDGLKSITDAELNEVLALVGRGRSIPAVIVAAIIRRLEAAEAPHATLDSMRSALAA
jgi:hypothetical protein